MKFLKLVSIILVLSMFSVLLLACNGNEEPTGSSSSSSSSSSSTSSSTTSATTTCSNNQVTPDNGDNNKPSTPVLPQNPSEDSSLSRYVDISDYNGTPFDEETSDIDIGQGSYMNVVKNTTLAEYNSFKKQLEDAGLKLYTTNTIGNNQFATYISKSQIVNVMFLAYDYDENDTSTYSPATSVDHNEVRIIVDETMTFDLPGLESDNKYTPNSAVTPKLIMLSDQDIGWPGRMGFVYQLADGSFFIIDGGYPGDGNASGSNPTAKHSSIHVLMAALKKNAPDPDNIIIAGWLFSHTHEDHIGAFCDLANNPLYKNSVTIERVIYNTPSDDELLAQDSSEGTKKWGDKLNASIEALKPAQQIKAHAGQKFFIRDLTMTIYTSQDTLLYSTDVANGSNYKSITWHNDTSIVAMVNYQDADALYLADSHDKSARFVLNPLYRNDLDCDILQVAHHGYGDTNMGVVYKHLDTPKAILWPSRKGHYDGKNPDGSVYYENGKVYGTGVVGVQFNKDYLLKDGVVNVYSKDNTCPVITDFKNLNSESCWSMVDYVK